MTFGDTRLPERFWSKVAPEPNTGCWLWTASLDKGYGQFYLGNKAPRKSIIAGAHRVAYEALVGPIPADLQLDHVKARGCTSRNCVNPDHLEPVTNHENMMRGDTIAARAAAKTHCPRGHEYAGENLYRWRGDRHCLACRRARDRSRKRR